MKQFLFSLLFITLSFGTAVAHPHVWIDSQLAVRLEAGRVSTLTITWVFDELYSELVLEDFDSDGDGVLGDAELAELARTSAETLPESSFFTQLRIDGQEQGVTSVEALTASLEEGLIVYRFTVKLPEPTDGKEKPLAVGLFDASYYVEMTLVEPITVEGGSCTSRLEVDQSQPLYYGYFFPTYIWLECEGV